MAERRIAASLLALMLGASLLGPPVGSAQERAPGHVAPEAMQAPEPAHTAAHAHELYLGADFEGARREAGAVIASSTDRAELVSALRVLVALESMTGTADSLAGAARSLALLDPTATPAEGAPDTALAAVVSARAMPAPEITIERQGSTLVAAATRPPSITSELSLTCDDALGPHRTSGPRDAAARLDVAADAEVSCTAELRTSAGLVLASAQRGSRPAPSGATAAGSSDELPWILLGVGGGVVVLGVVIGVAVAASSGGQPTFDAPVVIGW